MFTIAAFAVGVLLGASGKPEAGGSGAPPSRTKAAVPSGHSLDVSTGFAANDLMHGNGAWQLQVSRRWGGTATLNTTFGRGWSDQNDMRLTLISDKVLLLWRGGIGSNIAYRSQENVFEGDDGEKFLKTETGWTALMSHGRTLTFDKAGRLILERGASGPARNYGYDKNGRLISVGTAANNELRYSYDKEGAHVRHVDGPEGLALDFAYDEKGRLTSVVNSQRVRTEYRYADDGSLIAAKDQFGNQLELAGIRAVRQPMASAMTMLPAVPDFTKTKHQFDEQGRVKSTHEGPNSKSYEYDEAGRMTAVSTPEGRATCVYDGFGRIASIQSPGGTTRFAYNNLDLPTLVAKANGPAEKWTYDEHGRLLRHERSADDWEERSYDTAGRVALRRTPPAAEERYSYDDAGRTIGVRYSDGRAVSFEYDPSGRLLGESWASGEKRTWRYNADGQLAESVSPAGFHTTYTYDALGRLAATEDSIHGKTTHRPFAGGMIVETARGRTVTKTTKWGKPLSVVEPGGTLTVFDYDEKGLLRTSRPPLGLPWRYEYDAARNLTAILAPSGLRTSTQWDTQGRETKVMRGNVPWREFQYNPAGRIDQELSGTGRAARYVYGPDGRLAELELPDGKVAYTSTKDGLRFVRKGPGYEVEEDYSGNGTLTRRQYRPAGLDLKLPLDSAGRAAGIELNDLKAVYSYNVRGQLAQITLPGGGAIKVTADEAGRPSEFTFGAVVERIEYDRADRIVTIEATAGAGQRVFSERYSYDPAGNLSQRITDSAAPVKFEYDVESRLTRVTGGKTTQEFAYDVDGNLTTNSAGTLRCQIDSLGRPTQQGPTTYLWDAGGNLVGANDARMKLSNVFDTAGRLTERRDGKSAWKFGYLDGTDRLWKENASGKSWYAYAGERLAGFKDEAGVTWLLVCLPGTDRPLAVCGSNGRTLLILHDRLGSARRFVDAVGTVVARDDYAAFGKLEFSEGNAPVQLFAGIVRDETGLFYARQRYYDPSIARFISLDPLIGTPGNPSSHNAYAYAANNPLRYRDPLGAGSFEDEIANYNQQYPYKLGPPDANGIRHPLTYQEGPFKGEPIVDKSGPLSTVPNSAYDKLTSAEQIATRQAWEGQQAALRQLNNPASTAEQARAASQALARHEAELARLNEIGNLRNSHNLMEWGTSEKGYGGAGSDAVMARQEKRLTELGADPFAHYTEKTQARLRANREAGIAPSEAPEAKAAAQRLAEAQAQAEAEALAAAEEARREAMRAWGVGKPDTNQVPRPPPGSDAGGQAPNTTGAAAANAGSGPPKTPTLQSPVTSSGNAGAGGNAAPNGGAQAGGQSSGDVLARAREKMDRGLKNNEAVSISKEEMDALRADNAAKAAANKGRSATGPGEGAPGGEPIPFDAERGVFQPKSQGGAVKTPTGGVSSFAPVAEETGERWLGPKILEAGGKVLKPLAPVLKAVEVIQTVQLAGTMANNFIDYLNQPFAEAQKEKQGARWVAERYANELRKLAAADPDAVITGDGHKFDPNNPKDLEELMAGLGQNLYFDRKPFDGLLRHITNKPTSFMGAAEGDTAAAFSLESAWKLMRTALALEKAAGEAAKECIREEEEAKSQLQKAATIAAARSTASSELATLPETAEDAKVHTAAVQAQTKAMQAAFDEMKAAGLLCETAATNICSLAAQSGSATDEQVKQWRTQASTELFTASNTLNAAQVKIDGADVAVDQLEKAVARLEGSRLSLVAFNAGSGIADGLGVTPGAAFAAAKAAAERAGAARTKLGQTLGQLRPIPPQITALLAPYLEKDIEAVALDAEARKLGATIEPPPLVDLSMLMLLAAPLVEAALVNQQSVEQAIGRTNIDSVISAAREALTEARTVRENAKGLASGAERYQALQRASHCFAQIKSATESAIAETKPEDKPGDKTADDAGAAPMKPSAPPSPAETLTPEEMIKEGAKGNKAGGKVIVPNLAVFESVGEMKAVLSHAGLSGTFASGGKPPSKEKEFKFAGQSHPPNSLVDPGTTVVVTVYQKFDGTSSSDEEVTVPDLSGSASFEDTANIVRQRGLVHVLNAVDAPSKEKEKKFAGQSHAPNTKVKVGTPIVVSWYREFKAPAGDTVPKLTGLKLEEVDALLTPLKLKLGGVETSAKAEKPDQVDRIYAQDPPEGAKIPEKGVVSVKVYGSLKTADKPGGNPALDGMVAGAESGLVGEYEGTFDGKPMKVYVTRFGGQWGATLQMPSPDGRPGGTELGGSGAGRTVTVKDGVLTNTHVVNSGGSGNLKMTLTIKVNGGQLVGTYQYSDTRGDDPAMHKNQTTDFTATRTK